MKKHLTPWEAHGPQGVLTCRSYRAPLFRRGWLVRGVEIVGGDLAFADFKIFSHDGPSRPPFACFILMDCPRRYANGFSHRSGREFFFEAIIFGVHAQNMNDLFLLCQFKKNR